MRLIYFMKFNIKEICDLNCISLSGSQHLKIRGEWLFNVTSIKLTYLASKSASRPPYTMSSSNSWPDSASVTISSSFKRPTSAFWSTISELGTWQIPSQNPSTRSQRSKHPPMQERKYRRMPFPTPLSSWKIKLNKLWLKLWNRWFIHQIKL